MAFNYEDIDLGKVQGDSPYIGANGNWWIGDTDTGVCAGGDEKAYHFISDIIIPVGNDLSSGAVVTLNGFTGNLSNGFTHTKGDGEGSVVLANNNIDAGIYILEFDTSYTAGEFVRCGFADDYKNYAYNGKAHIVMPLRFVSGVKALHIVSCTDVTYTISNITLRKVTEGGDTTITLSINSHLNESQNPENFGFYNLLLSRNNAKKAVGSTRTIAIGESALAELLGGHRLIALGTFAMQQLKNGEKTISIGADNMQTTKSAEQSVSIGIQTLYTAQEVVDTVGIGNQALFNSKKSAYNVAIGKEAGININANDGTNAAYNTYIGVKAGYRNRRGSANVSIGGMALGGNGGGNNVNIGYNSTYETDCEGTISLGADSKATKSYQMMLGSSNITEVVFCGNKKIKFNSDGTVTWEALN